MTIKCLQERGLTDNLYKEGKELAKQSSPKGRELERGGVLEKPFHQQSCVQQAE